MNRIISFFSDLGRFTVFGIEVFKHVPAVLRHPSEVMKYIVEIGVQSLPIVCTTGFFTGMILGLELGDALEAIIAGTSQFIGGALSVSIVKELGPVLTSLIVVSRVCSSATAHIGTMRVTEQIDALHTMAVNPIKYLVTPRVLAGIICLPILSFFSIMLSMTGGWIMVTSVQQVDNRVFWEWAQIPMKSVYVVESLFKTMTIGGTIMLISTYCGYFTRGGAEGVGEATIKSVVTASFLVILMDYIIGSVFIILL